MLYGIFYVHFTIQKKNNSKQKYYLEINFLYINLLRIILGHPGQPFLLPNNPSTAAHQPRSPPSHPLPNLHPPSLRVDPNHYEVAVLDLVARCSFRRR